MSRRRSVFRSIFLSALAGASVAACFIDSPTEDAEIEALGPELPDVAPSEFHRPGQPCTTCHDEYGPGNPVFSVGGTVFATNVDKVPVEGATVTLTDSRGEVRTAVTNCVGNFFIEDATFRPVYPMGVTVDCPLTGPVAMQSLINREGSCAFCHANQPSPTSAGWVYCAVADPDAPPPPANPNCPGRVP
ncbi:MAG: carboxypeptidase-like regulatory domain-containing protein [Myxococcota bacterium]